MPITIVADSLEELAEPLRKVAQQKDGKFVLTSLPEGFALEDVRGLKATVQTLRQETKEKDTVLRSFLDAGLTAEEAAKAADALSKHKAGTLKSSAELDAWKAQAEEKFKTDAQKLTDRLTKRTDRLRNELVRGKLAPIVAAKGGANAMDAILTLAERNIRVEETAEGDLVPIVVGSDGKTAALTKKSGSMDPMGFDELVDLMRESPQTKGLFEVKATGGSGSASQSRGSGQAGNQDSSKLSAKERIIRGHTANA